MSSTTAKPRCDLRSEYDMACPHCGHADTLSIEIVRTATLSINGTEAESDHYWDDASPCSCDACDYHGTAVEFRITADDEVQS